MRRSSRTRRPDRRIRTTCELTEPLGAEVLVHFTVSAPVLVAGAAGDADPTLGASPPGSEEGRARLIARVDPRSKITEGSEIELAVDTSRLYFFDPESRRRSSGLALDGAGGEAGEDPPLQHEREHDQRHGHDDGGRHDLAPRLLEGALSGEARDGDGHRVLLG